MEEKKLRELRREKIERIYKRLEQALLEEECTYEEANSAIGRLKWNYFDKKAGIFLNNVTIQEIAKADASKPEHS